MLTSTLNIPDAELEQRLLSTSITRVKLQRLAMRGLHASEAAKLLGIHEATARRHYADPDFRRAVIAKVDGAFADTDAAFIERTKTLPERLEEQAAKSFDALVAMLDPVTNGGRALADHLKIKVHQDFLDRVAETATIQRGHFKIDPLELSHAARVAAEMDSPVVVQMPRQLKEASA